MRVIICSFWCDLDSPFIDKGDSPSLVWVLCGKKHKKTWKLALLCFFWIVWKERNRIPLPLIDFFYWLGSR